jgi:hypothetical protein
LTGPFRHSAVVYWTIKRSVGHNTDTAAITMPVFAHDFPDLGPNTIGFDYQQDKNPPIQSIPAKYDTI